MIIFKLFQMKYKSSTVKVDYIVNIINKSPLLVKDISAFREVYQIFHHIHIISS